MISNIDLMIWDLETTGLVAPEAKILEIGAFIVRGGDIEVKHWVLDNKCDIPEEIIKITGITPEIIEKEGRDPKECIAEFLPYFKEAKTNVTHNGIKFDIPFLIDYAVDLMGYTEVNKKAITELINTNAFDTAVYFKARKLHMQQGKNESFLSFAKRVMGVRAYGIKYNLGLCCDEMKIEKGVQHRAIADVDLTYKLYKAISTH